MGRYKKNERKQEHFAKLTRAMMETAAWQALSCTAQALYPWLRLEWHGPDANNNGQIFLSVRQAEDRLGVSRNTAARAFHDLQAKGFIVVKEGSHLGMSGEAKATQYELTELPLPGTQGNQGCRLYKNWKPGADFPVVKASANNPTGRNGKEKPVINIETFRH